MSTLLYIKLSVVMALEYAVWGAWMPVLAARLLGPLRFSGKQTGWIYATLPLACIISPLISGQIADKWLNAEWILVGAHLIGAVLLLIAAAQTRFAVLFAVMFLYSVFYAATLPLVNAVLFANVTDAAWQGKVFMWAPIAWAIAGYFLTGWRWTFKTAEKGRDCLFLAAALSVIMAASCLALPSTPPAGVGEAPILKAMSMLQNTNFLVFMIVSLVAGGLMQFYFLGSARFMMDTGIAGRNVPATMAIAQVVQAVATYYLLNKFIGSFGFKWTLTIGAAAWFLLYLVYVISKPRALIVISQSLHGLAYVLFIIAGQIFANIASPPEIRSSVQALVFVATTGVGLFLGTQFAGVVMDIFRKEDRFNWRAIFSVPTVIMFISIIVLVVLFKG
ncbi:MAG: MFS transporter [Sedimentisphaerales bacterium]|jgi:nucleoside transporter